MYNMYSMLLFKLPNPFAALNPFNAIGKGLSSLAGKLCCMIPTILLLSIVIPMVVKLVMKIWKKSKKEINKAKREVHREEREAQMEDANGVERTEVIDPSGDDYVVMHKASGRNRRRRN